MDVLWTETLYGNSLARWLAAIAIVVATVVLVRVGVSVISSQLSRLTAKTKTQADDILGKVVSSTRWYLVAITALRPAIGTLVLPARIVSIIHVAASVALTLQVGLWLQRGAVEFLQRRRDEDEEEDPARETTQNAVLFLVKIVLWALVGVAVLGNLGIEVTALVAGLGIGGVAAALAVQNVLGDLIASLSIYLDRRPVAHHAGARSLGRGDHFPQLGPRPHEGLARLRRGCRALFRRIGLRDYGRLDFRCDAEGCAKLIDANPNPTWYANSRLASAARWVGYDYPRLVTRIIELARSRVRATSHGDTT